MTKNYRVDSITLDRFLDTYAVYGRLFTVEGSGLFSKLIMWAEHVLFGSTGTNSHAGIISHDGFCFEMVGKLRYQWLGFYFLKGSTKRLKIWDLKPCYKKNVTEVDLKIAFGDLKRRYREGVGYDWLSILSLGLLRSTKREICSGLVKEYLLILLSKSVPISLITDEFFTPDELSRYCDLVGSL